MAKEFDLLQPKRRAWRWETLINLSTNCLGSRLPFPGTVCLSCLLILTGSILQIPFLYRFPPQPSQSYAAKRTFPREPPTLWKQKLPPHPAEQSELSLPHVTSPRTEYTLSVPLSPSFLSHSLCGTLCSTTNKYMDWCLFWGCPSGQFWSRLLYRPPHPLSWRCGHCLAEMGFSLSPTSLFIMVGQWLSSMILKRYVSSCHIYFHFKFMAI